MRTFYSFVAACLLAGFALPAWADTNVTTRYVKNASFESGFNNWTQANMQTQTNTSFTLKAGNTYVEKWVSKGSRVGSASIYQTLTNLTAGNYRLQVAAQNIQQDNATAAQTGAYIYAGSERTTVTVPAHYEVSFTTLGDAVEVGFKAASASGNWVCADNFRLYYVDTDAEALLPLLRTRIAEAEKTLAKTMQPAVKQALQTAIDNAQSTLDMETPDADAIQTAARALYNANQTATENAAALTALRTACSKTRTYLLRNMAEVYKTALQTAYDAAQAIVNLESDEDIEEAAAALDAAYNDAVASYDAYTTLSKAIRTASTLSTTDKEGVEELELAIATAQAVLDKADATPAEMDAATADMEKATLLFRVANGTGTEPTARTLSVVQGATVIFARGTFTSGKEYGFCYSQDPEPTIYDQRATTFYSNNGNIYYMENLKPATVYYVRAYCISNGYKVGYGDVVKVPTRPKGNVSYDYDNAGDAATNQRIIAACEEAVWMWNNVTGIQGFNLSAHYVPGAGAGDGTADCSYGGYMRISQNAAYQKTGTVLHEGAHGQGMVNYTDWVNPIYRTNGDRGDWLGARVDRVIQFLDNNASAKLHGDYQHMWPYGINGASEDNGTKELYYANAMIGQALGEDGLEHRSNTFAEPCYMFTHDDDTKYYLKCEDEERGLYTSYLIPNKNGILTWRAMTAAEAQLNDSAAWYFSFTPATQYYHLRNAATGQYMTYTGAFKTISRTTLTTSEDFHLMRGRTDVGSGTGAKRGYWFIHPTNNLAPNAMTANANGAVGSSTFDISNTATKQRWLILTAEETDAVEKAAVESLRSNFMDILANIKELLKVPHTQLKAGTDQTYEAAIADLEQQAQSATQPYVLLGLQAVASKEMMTFLSNVHATDENKPFDLTFLMTAPGMDSTDGWVGTKPTLNYSCAEFYQTTFDLWQNVSDLPGGQYKVRVQGFQRPGTTANAYANYTAGKDNITSYLYAGTTTNATKLADISADAQKTKVGKGNESTVGGSFYVPNNMQAASAYFDKGLYENSVDATVDTDGGSLRIGLRCTSAQDYYWTIFDNFRLHFFGKPVTTNEGDVNGDGTVDVADISSIIDIMAGNVGAAPVSAHAADINGDGTVDVADIATVISIMAEK